MAGRITICDQVFHSERSSESANRFRAERAGNSLRFGHNFDFRINRWITLAEPRAFADEARLEDLVLAFRRSIAHVDAIFNCAPLAISLRVSKQIERRSGLTPELPTPHQCAPTMSLAVRECCAIRTPQRTSGQMTFSQKAWA
jgi:hypothetical protein